MAENDTLKDDTIDLGENWDAVTEPHNTTQDQQSEHNQSTEQQDDTTIEEEKEHYNIDATGGAIRKTRNTTGLNTHTERTQGTHINKGQVEQAEAIFQREEGMMAAVRNTTRKATGLNPTFTAAMNTRWKTSTVSREILSYNRSKIKPSPRRKRRTSSTPRQNTLHRNSSYLSLIHI